MELIKIKLKNLYLSSIVKWKWICALYKKGYNYEATDLARKQCSFCRDVKRNYHLLCQADGYADCRKYCKIDIKICGSLICLVIKQTKNEKLAFKILKALIVHYNKLKQK